MPHIMGYQSYWLVSSEVVGVASGGVEEGCVQFVLRKTCTHFSQSLRVTWLQIRLGEHPMPVPYKPEMILHLAPIKAKALCFPVEITTFKEDKFPIFSFISSIDSCRQTSPEMSNWHGVIFHNPIITNAPEPLILKHREMNGDEYTCRVISDPTRTQIFCQYLKHKHFSSENANGVKMALADVRTKARSPRPVRCGIWSVMGGLRCDRRSRASPRVWSCRVRKFTLVI